MFEEPRAEDDIPGVTRSKVTLIAGWSAVARSASSRPFNFGNSTSVIIACLGTLYLGVRPGGLLSLTGEAIRSLVG